MQIGSGQHRNRVAECGFSGENRCKTGRFAGEAEVVLQCRLAQVAVDEQYTRAGFRKRHGQIDGNRGFTFV